MTEENNFDPETILNTWEEFGRETLANEFGVIPPEGEVYTKKLKYNPQKKEILKIF